MKKYRIISLSCAALMMLQLMGCSSAETSSTQLMENMKSYTFAEDSAPAEFNGMAYDTEYFDATVMTTEAYAPGENNVQNDLASRKIIKNATLSFETKAYDEFMSKLEQCINGLGGYIESSEAYGGGIYNSRSRDSHITARIPETNYNKFMYDVCELGTMTFKSESSDDVTMSYVDTEMHIKALETEYDALLEILDKATSLDDVIQLQSRISEVTYQIDSYKSQLRKYDDLISYCTVNISVSEVWRENQNKEAMSFGERIISGLQDTFYDIGEDLTDFSVVFIVSLPYILIWAVVIFILGIILRRVISFVIKSNKKKKEQKHIEQYYKKANENTKHDSENP